MSSSKPQTTAHQHRIRDEFTRQADTMATAAVFTDQEILDRIRQAAGLTPQSQVLDLACGSGIVAEALAHDWSRGGDGSHAGHGRPCPSPLC
ncbi:hypothetical protein C2W62_22795 [Candidatus Entotheonella serta]|nr:hypothetical protein C2W62_22795 [Candidatus Entotheonella serta]